MIIAYRVFFLLISLDLSKRICNFVGQMRKMKWNPWSK